MVMDMALGQEEQVAQGEPSIVGRHAAVVRATHWVNALVLLVLLLSGLQIFNAHPALYWGDKAVFADPWFANAGELEGAYLDLARGLTIAFDRHCIDIELVVARVEDVRGQRHRLAVVDAFEAFARGDGFQNDAARFHNREFRPRNVRIK